MAKDKTWAEQCMTIVEKIEKLIKEEVEKMKLRDQSNFHSPYYVGYADALIDIKKIIGCES